MIVVTGLSHRTAPLDIREAIALSPEQATDLLRRAVDSDVIAEALLVSTCNRVELVTAGFGAGGTVDALAQASRAVLQGHAPVVTDHLYAHQGIHGVRHLFRVASSLDSLVLGEPQILGQVKQAYDRGCQAGTVGSALHRAITRAIRAAKRVRTETAIGSGQVSVPSVAVDLARQIFGELRGHTAVLIGSGEMAETVVRLLRGAGAKILVVGRNRQRVVDLAKLVQGEPRHLHEMSQVLIEADVVITSTSAPGYVIPYDAVAPLRRSRRGRSLFLIDLAVPRDVDPRLEQLDSTFVYNVDDLSKVVADSRDARAKEAEHAEQIVLEEAAGFERWAGSLQATPTIVSLRSRFQSVLDGELEKSLRGRLRHLDSADREALGKMAEAAVNKLLHSPSVRLRQVAAGPELEATSLDELVGALEELFELDVHHDDVGGAQALPGGAPDSQPSAGRVVSLTSRVARRGER